MEMQPGFTLWLTGEYRAGKSTLARYLAGRLPLIGRRVELLDGSAMETLPPEAPNATREASDRSVRHLGWMARLLTRNGVITVVASLSPHKETRDEVRRSIGRFVEVEVKADFEALKARDEERIYARALAGELENVIGVQVPYTTEKAELKVDTTSTPVETLAAQVFDKLFSLGFLSRKERDVLISGNVGEMEWTPAVVEAPVSANEEFDEEDEDDSFYDREVEAIAPAPAPVKKPRATKAARAAEAKAAKVAAVKAAAGRAAASASAAAKAGPETTTAEKAPEAEVKAPAKKPATRPTEAKAPAAKIAPGKAAARTAKPAAAPAAPAPAAPNKAPKSGQKAPAPKAAAAPKVAEAKAPAAKGKAAAKAPAKSVPAPKAAPKAVAAKTAAKPPAPKSPAAKAAKAPAAKAPAAKAPAAKAAPAAKKPAANGKRR